MKYILLLSCLVSMNSFAAILDSDVGVSGALVANVSNYDDTKASEQRVVLCQQKLDKTVKSLSAFTVFNVRNCTITKAFTADSSDSVYGSVTFIR